MIYLIWIQNKIIYFSQVIFNNNENNESVKQFVISNCYPFYIYFK